jgi:hypothetical protein
MGKQLIQDQPSKTRKLYDILSKDSNYSNVLPKDFGEFEQKLSDTGFASKFYDVLKKDSNYTQVLPEKVAFITDVKTYVQPGPV